jgi:hypothetical protein
VDGQGRECGYMMGSGIEIGSALLGTTRKMVLKIPQLVGTKFTKASLYTAGYIPQAGNSSKEMV